MSAAPHRPAQDTRTVLLVEDGFLVAGLMRRILEEAGHTVLGPISRLREALAVAGDQEYDVALLDITLAEGNSFEVARRALRRGRRAVFVTGYGSIEALPEDLRPLPRLIKPVDAADLLLAVGS
jgi:CheY-like chemotaxis protein